VSAANRDLIHSIGLSVWLRADLELLWQRVRHKATRPLLQAPNPREALRRLYEARLTDYAKADLVVDSLADLSVEDMAARVIAAA
jgi:shikimate kinase